MMRFIIALSKQLAKNWASAESISFRMFRLFFAFIALGAICFTLVSTYSQTIRAREELYTKGQTLSLLLADSLRVGVFSENQGQLADPVSGIMRQKEVLSIAVFAADGRELYRKSKPEFAAVGGPASYYKLTSSLPERRTMLGKEYVEFMEPVVLEIVPKSEEAIYFDAPDQVGKTRIIGSVILIIDTSQLVVNNMIIIGQNIIGALFMLFAGAILLFYVLEKSLGPLRKLTHEVVVFGEGGEINPIPVDSVDEVGRLAASFNAMTENLKKREQEAHMYEQKLRHAEKMEAVGTLSRGIAHDFNNILTSIEGSVYALKRHVDRGQQKYNYLVHMDNALARAHVLIDGLMVFSRGQEPKRVTVEINSLLRNLMPGITGILGEGLVCELQVYYRDLMVLGDGFQLTQMLMNLVINAKDAMSGSGKILVKTGMIAFGEDEKIIGLLPGPGKYAFIVISDSGEGIRDEIRERIFEPFFTTKEVGKGTGLGLSIVYGIVKEHKGHVEIYSEPGIGTEFRIYLPLFEKA